MNDHETLLTALRDAPICLALQPTSQQCTRDATTHIQVGCVHEHVSTVPLCSPCADTVCAGGALCIPCRTGEDPHDCDLLGRIAS